MNAKVLVFFAVVAVATAMQCPAGLYKHCNSCDRVGNCIACEEGYSLNLHGVCAASLDGEVDSGDTSSSVAEFCSVYAKNTHELCQLCMDGYCNVDELCFDSTKHHFLADCDPNYTTSKAERGVCQKGYRGALCSDSAEEEKDDGLSPGAIAGIVIAVIIVVFIIIVLIVLLVSHKKATKAYKGDTSLFEDGVEFDSVSVL